jgi:hypothetical protein
VPPSSSTQSGGVGAGADTNTRADGNAAQSGSGGSAGDVTGPPTGGAGSGAAGVSVETAPVVFTPDEDEAVDGAAVVVAVSDALQSLPTSDELSTAVDDAADGGSSVGKFIGAVIDAIDIDIERECRASCPVYQYRPCAVVRVPSSSATPPLHFRAGSLQLSIHCVWVPCCAASMPLSCLWMSCKRASVSLLLLLLLLSLLLLLLLLQSSVVYSTVFVDYPTVCPSSAASQRGCRRSSTSTVVSSTTRHVRCSRFTAHSALCARECCMAWHSRAVMTPRSRGFSLCHRMIPRMTLYGMAWHGIAER